MISHKHERLNSWNNMNEILIHHIEALVYWWIIMFPSNYLPSYTVCFLCWSWLEIIVVISIHLCKHKVLGTNVYIFHCPHFFALLIKMHAIIGTGLLLALTSFCLRKSLDLQSTRLQDCNGLNFIKFIK